MGRHSLDPAPGATGVPTTPTVAPVTDPVLLDAVQRELRRVRIDAQPAAAPRPAPITRRVETPFSGPVDVPAENVIGPHRPDGATGWNPPVLRTPAAPPRAAARPPAAAPAPVPARPVPASRSSATTGPVIVPTHRPAPVPVEAQVDPDEEALWRGPVGSSLRTTLLCTGIGLAVASALSLLTLIPR